MRSIARLTRRSPLFAAAVAFLLQFLGPSRVDATTPAADDDRKPKILCVTATGGFRHRDGIAAARKVLPEMSRTSGVFDIEISNTTEKISREGLAGFDAIFFCNTTGDLGKFPLDEAGREALIGFVESGGAFIGAHSATDTFKDWKPYWEMIGGSFNGHPWGSRGPAVTIDVEDPSHPSAVHLPTQWIIQDEIYWFRNYSRDRLHVILSLNEVSLKAKNKPLDTDVPVAWCKTHGKGRVFYTSLGHRGDVWTNPVYQQHLLGGIRWALGKAGAYVKAGHEKEAGPWKRIFDGETLKFGEEWETTDNAQETRKHWTVQPGGILQGHWPKGKPGPGSSHLYYIKRPFRNFEYRADVRLNPGGNSGMYFRCDPMKNSKVDGGRKVWRNWPDGDEAQVKVGPGDPKKTGTLYPGKPAVSQDELNRFLGVDTTKEPVWITQHVIAVGNRIVIKLNGKIIREQMRMKNESGHFAYQLHHKGTKVQYRNIEVRELFE